jgi:CheY-like chemotaxis protein
LTDGYPVVIAATNRVYENKDYRAARPAHCLIAVVDLHGAGFGGIRICEEFPPMSDKSALTDKVILVVDDEPDVLETVADLLSMSIVHKAPDFETARQYLLSYTYDVVILDIMGVNGFELLKISTKREFPTVMLTAHAVTPEAVKKSIQLGAVSFLPKEKLADLKEFIEDVVLHAGRPMWIKVFQELGAYFNKRFGPDWKEKDRFLSEFEQELRAGSENKPSR